MSKRDIGNEILEGIRDIKAYKAGKKSLRVHSLRARLAAGNAPRWVGYYIQGDSYE